MSCARLLFVCIQQFVEMSESVGRSNERASEWVTDAMQEKRENVRRREGGSRRVRDGRAETSESAESGLATVFLGGG